MRARSVLAFVVPVIIGLAGALAGPGEAHAKIKCGSVLGPGGSYVLNRDLTCLETPLPPDSSDGRIGVIKVIGGATLDLNGHTVTCLSRSWGIVVLDSTLMNGTVRGCGLGVVPSRSVVKRMVFDGNVIGVSLREAYHGAGSNVIMGNVAKNGDIGFDVEEGHDQILIDNIAQDNGRGFVVNVWGGRFFGNTAIRNNTGFDIDGGGPLIGNRAKKNGVGFDIRSAGELIGNIAKKNTGVGFWLGGGDPGGLRVLEGTRHNVARGNGSDGFRIDVEDSVEHLPEAFHATLQNNYALGNGGAGFHVWQGGGRAPSPPKTITRNVALKNRGGDLTDDSDCRWTIWLDNTFETAAQACID